MKNTTRLPQKTAKSTTRISAKEMATGAISPTTASAEELQKEKRKKLNQRGSTYAAPKAPNPVAGNLRKGTTRMGGY